MLKYWYIFVCVGFVFVGVWCDQVTLWCVWSFSLYLCGWLGLFWVCGCISLVVLLVVSLVFMECMFFTVFFRGCGFISDIMLCSISSFLCGCFEFLIGIMCLCWALYLVCVFVNLVVCVVVLWEISNVVVFLILMLVLVCLFVLYDFGICVLMCLLVGVLLDLFMWWFVLILFVSFLFCFYYYFRRGR